MPLAALSLLLLDFDGVLASYSRPRRVAALAAAAACTPQRVQQVLFEQGLERAYDAGLIDTQDYLAQLSEGLGGVIDRATWIDARVAACRADPSVVAQVLAVSATTAVAVLTNNGPLMVEAIERIVLRCFRYCRGACCAAAHSAAASPMCRCISARLRSWTPLQQRAPCLSTTCSSTFVARVQQACTRIRCAMRAACGGC